MRFTFHAVVFNPVWNNQRGSKKQETSTNGSALSPVFFANYAVFRSAGIYIIWYFIPHCRRK